MNKLEALKEKIRINIDEAATKEAMRIRFIEDPYKELEIEGILMQLFKENKAKEAGSVGEYEATRYAFKEAGVLHKREVRNHLNLGTRQRSADSAVEHLMEENELEFDILAMRVLDVTLPMTMVERIIVTAVKRAFEKKFGPINGATRGEVLQWVRDEDHEKLDAMHEAIDAGDKRLEEFFFDAVDELVEIDVKAPGSAREAADFFKKVAEVAEERGMKPETVEMARRIASASGEEADRKEAEELLKELKG